MLVSGEGIIPRTLETYSLWVCGMFPFRHWGDGVPVSDGLFEAIDMRRTVPLHLLIFLLGLCL